MKKYFCLATTLLIMTFLMGQIAGAKLIHTKDGKVRKGKVIGQEDGHYIIDLGYGEINIPMDKVVLIEDEPEPTATSTKKPTPKPTNTRIPTSSPTSTPTITPVPTVAPTDTPQPGSPEVTGLSSVVYSAQQADILVKKYQKTLIPKAKYVLAYFAKGLHAADEKRYPDAIQAWNKSLEINNSLFRGPQGKDTKPILEEYFETALDILSLEARRDPAASIARNALSRQALRNVNLLILWVNRQFDIHISLGRAYSLSNQDDLAVENYLKAHRLLFEQRPGYLQSVINKTEQADIFNIRGLFFIPRAEVGGRLVDSRLAEVQNILDRQFDLQPDDYLYDYE